MDKWQKREAEQLAEAEGISYDEAVARLYPPDAPAEDEQAPAAEDKTPGAGVKAKLTK